MKHTYTPTKEEIMDKRNLGRLTQYKAAALVNATPATWNRWENGAAPMPPERWALFNFEVDTLIEEREPKPEPKQRNLSVHEMKKVEADEEKRRQEAIRQRNEAIFEAERQRARDDLNRLRPEFEQYKDLLRIRFPSVDKDFKEAETSAWRMQEAIGQLRDTYNRYAEEINMRIEGTWTDKHITINGKVVLQEDDLLI